MYIYKVDFEATFRFDEARGELKEKYRSFTTPQFSEFFIYDKKVSQMSGEAIEKTLDQWREEARRVSTSLAASHYIHVLRVAMDGPTWPEFWCRILASSPEKILKPPVILMKNVSLIE